MYRKIIFDLDGVITSESAFWDAAALTVAEFMGFPMDTPTRLRETLFCHDKLIRLVKNRGVNSNWDLVYLFYCFFETTPEAVYETIEKSGLCDFALYEAAGQYAARKTGKPHAEIRRGGPLYREMANSFQEWFLGSETFEKVNAKTPRGNREGLWLMEEPIVGREKLLSTLAFLKERGLSLRIATARPLPEGREPLVRWGAMVYFDADGAITYDYIRRAQALSPDVPLGKPHPYIFLKSYFGKDFPDTAILKGQYDCDFSDCLIVGDAGADLFAAKKMGADFAAVLTGISGEDGRAFFEENGAKYILPDVSALLSIPDFGEEEQK